jgi:hypothetical protein
VLSMPLKLDTLRLIQPPFSTSGVRLVQKLMRRG